MKILLFKGDGIAAPHLVTTVASYLKKLGHRVRFVYLKNEVQSINRECNSFNPDFVFALDHTGIHDEELNLNKQFYCSWFVDNPLYFVDKGNFNEYHISAFTDPYFEKILTNIGSNYNIFLPLGCDTDVFYPGDYDNNKQINDVTFVGSFLGSNKLLQLEMENNLSVVFQNIIKMGISIIETDEKLFFYDILDLIESKNNVHFKEKLTKFQKGGLLNYFDKLLDTKNKTSLLKVLMKFNSNIYGNKLWEKVVCDASIYKGHINYGNNLAQVYKNSKINVILTRPQISKGVNQRVFDIPAVGSFFLSDFREELKIIFPTIWEKIIYRDFDELEYKINYYLKNEDERNDLAKVMHDIIVSNHCYKRRLKKFIDHIEKIIK